MVFSERSKQLPSLAVPESCVQDTHRIPFSRREPSKSRTLQRRFVTPTELDDASDFVDDRAPNLDVGRRRPAGKSKEIGLAKCRVVSSLMVPP